MHVTNTDSTQPEADLVCLGEESVSSLQSVGGDGVLDTSMSH